MAKIILPIAEVQNGGTLHSWYYDEAIIRSDVNKKTDSINATAEGIFDLSLGNVGSILTNGGEVEAYLMAVHAPMSLLDTEVPDGLPKRMTLDGSAVEVPKAFKHWILPGAELWKKDDDTEILFYTNPFAGNVFQYLKGSEISIINDIHATVEILTIVDAEILVATGWTKITEL